MQTPTAKLQRAIEDGGYHFVKCNTTNVWLCIDNADLSEVVEARTLGECIKLAADKLGF